jgi:WD40 repeat protein
MNALATRRRRRRRIAVASAFITLLVVLAVVGSLWRRSVQETRRAEASKLLALAQVQLDTDPTEALAYAAASLEMADTEEARVFAVRALWEGPPLSAIDLEKTAEGQYAIPTFSPDGRWLAVAGLANENVLVYGEDGREPVVLGGHAAVADEAAQCIWTADGLLVTSHWTEVRARVWAMPEGSLIREIDLGGSGYLQVGDTHLFAEVFDYDPDTWVFPPEVVRLRSWQLAGGEPEELGTVEGSLSWYSAFDPAGGAWVFPRGGSIFSRPLPVRADVPDRVIARHSSDAARVGHWRRGRGLYSSDDSGELVLWTAAEGTSVDGQWLGRPETAATRLRPDPGGRWAVDADASIREGKASLWDLLGLAGARPIELRRSGSWYYSFSDFHPGGAWVVATTNDLREVSFWPVQARAPHVVDGYETKYRRCVAFTPDGRNVVTHWGRDPVRVRLWPLPGVGDRDVVDLMLSRDGPTLGLAVGPAGKNVLSTGYGAEIFLVSVTGAEPRRLEGLGSDGVVNGAFSPSGRLVAAASTYSESQPTLLVWELVSGESRVFDQPRDPDAERFTGSIAFVDETMLYTSGSYGLLRWDLEAGTYESILEVPPGNRLEFSMASDRRRSLVYELGPSDDRLGAALHDLETGDVRSLDIPGQGFVIALSPDGTTWATGEGDGSVWIGRIDGGEAHLLAGHEGPVDSVAISPDNRWIASSGYDKTLRLWPMPDLSKPPLHTLPHDELIAKLKSLTNLRAVRDEVSATGWTIEVGPFPGWDKVPVW